MDDNKIREICQTRLDQWTEVLINAHSTPALLLGVGHDQVSGEIQLIIPEDCSEDKAIILLTNTLAKLTERKQKTIYRQQN